MVGMPKRAKGCEACRKRRINVGNTYGRTGDEKLTSISVIMGAQNVPNVRQKIETADMPTLLRLLSTILAFTGLDIENLSQIDQQLMNVSAMCPQTVQRLLLSLSFATSLQICVRQLRLNCHA